MTATVLDWAMGETDEEESIEVLQGLIDSGQAWLLEGSVGRTAMGAIEAGACVLGTEGHRDYWGNYVPSRYEVKAGTKGSPQYGHRYGHHDEPHREGGKFVACPFK